jgi:pimeloyl-ACP methyl ester carboxylesterase
MMCDARLYGPQIDALSGRFALHLAPIGGHATIPALAAEVLAHAPPRFALAGLSMGGIVAMEMLAQAPDRIEKLALLDTNPRAELPEVAARRLPQIEKVRAGALAGVIRDEMKPNYLADTPRKGAVLDLCMAMALDLGPEVFIRQSRALAARADRQDTLRAVRVPTLVLCGAEDRLCPVERHALMHGLIPGSVLHVVENAGHMPTLEQPEETTAALLRWLED